MAEGTASAAGRCGTDATQSFAAAFRRRWRHGRVPWRYRLHQPWPVLRRSAPCWQEAARAALAEAAALAGRLAPAAAAAARAASGPAAALSVLVTPTSSQGETIELGDGLRARTSTGQTFSQDRAARG